MTVTVLLEKVKEDLRIDFNDLNADIIDNIRTAIAVCSFPALAYGICFPHLAVGSTRRFFSELFSNLAAVQLR